MAVDEVVFLAAMDTEENVEEEAEMADKAIAVAVAVEKVTVILKISLTPQMSPLLL